MLLILGTHGGTAGKHVFAEKPLCCGTASEVAELFQHADPGLEPPDSKESPTEERENLLLTPPPR